MSGVSLDIEKLIKEKANKELRRLHFDAKPLVEAKLQDEIRSRFNVRKKSFPKTFRGYVAYKNPARPPVAVFKFSEMKVPWIGIHGTGGAVVPRNGKGLLIPFNVRGQRRLSNQQFRAVVAGLMRTGNYDWRKGDDGKVYLFAENIRENADELRRFGKMKTGADGKRRRVAELPVAVLVPKVMMPKRLDVDDLARRVVLPIYRQLLG